jgi:alanyl-tRNA synthetase
MSDNLFFGIAVVLVVLAVTNGYWWRRMRATQKALRTSVDRDKRVATNAQQSDETSEKAVTSQVRLKKAASRANCPPQELPAQIDRLQEKLREEKNETERLRREWADSWWTARRREPPDTPGVVVGQFDGATTEEIQTIAKYADHPQTVSILIAVSAGAVTVRVGDSLTDQFAAADIVADICDSAGGSGGGSAALATGGGVEPSELLDEVERVQGEIATELTSGSS